MSWREFIRRMIEACDRASFPAAEVLARILIELGKTGEQRDEML